MANAPNGKKASLTLILVMFTVCVFVFCPSPKKWKKWKKWKIWGPLHHQRIERNERFEGPHTIKEMKEMKELRVPAPTKKWKNWRSPHPQRNERNERYKRIEGPLICKEMNEMNEIRGPHFQWKIYLTLLVFGPEVFEGDFWCFTLIDVSSANSESLPSSIGPSKRMRPLRWPVI